MTKTTARKITPIRSSKSPKLHHHQLILQDLGPDRYLRWAPKCACGRWYGVPGRTKSVWQQYREHRRARGSFRNVPKPQPITPEADLPQLLRTA